MVTCCRCGGPTRLDKYELGHCLEGSKNRTCGHWWRRDGGCRWDWVRTSDVEPGGECPGGCWWDHRLFFQPTITTPEGEEHRYHAPGASAHSVVVVVRPKGSACRLATIRLSPAVSTPHEQRRRRLRVLYSDPTL